jgi:hypothetical protein
MVYHQPIKTKHAIYISSASRRTHTHIILLVAYPYTSNDYLTIAGETTSHLVKNHQIW